MDITPNNSDSNSTNQSGQLIKFDLLENSLVEPLGEFVLDAIFKNGILKDLPGFSIILATLKAPKSLNDYLLTRNIQRFYKPLTNISDIERQTFINKLENQPKFRERVGENGSP